MNSTTRMKLINVGIWALLVLAAFVSASHIVDTAGTLGLTGWYRYAAVALIDFVAIVGKLSMHDGFSEPFRKSGFRLLMAGGVLSLGANVYAGDNLGERSFGALTVGVFMLLEHHATKAGQKAVADKPKRKLPADVAAERAAKAAATRAANKAAAEALAEAERRASLTRGQRAAETKARRAAVPVSGAPMGEYAGRNA